MMRASEPRGELLYETMRGSDPDAAMLAFRKFLITPAAWWEGDFPLSWALKAAKQHLARLERDKWPVHKLGDPEAIAHDALMLLLRLAPQINSPPAFLRYIIQRSMEWEIAGRGRKGEPWGYDPEDVLEWKAAPSTDSGSSRLWEDVGFCQQVALSINRLSKTLRPYAILNLLDAQRPVDIARTLKVGEAKARKYVGRALQALVGRRDGSRLADLPTTRTIRRALAMPDGVVVAEHDAAVARQREEAKQLKAAKQAAKAAARSNKGAGPRKV